MFCISLTLHYLCNKQSKNKEMRHKNILAAIVALCLFTACRSHYHMTGIERSRILVAERYDAAVGQLTAINEYMAPYKMQVDSIMKPLLGHTAGYYVADRPESELSNLLPDILMWAASQYGEQPDFAVYNTGGMRAALPEGEITVGDILELAPFENKICFLTLTGDKVLELAQQIVGRGGEGISKEFRIVGVKNKKNHRLIEATVNGQPIDPARKYRIVTIDYVSHGNDEMKAFLSATDIRMPGEERDLSKYVIMRYFQEMEKQGRVVEAKIDGRMTLKEE